MVATRFLKSGGCPGVEEGYASSASAASSPSAASASGHDAGSLIGGVELLFLGFLAAQLGFVLVHAANDADLDIGTDVRMQRDRHRLGAELLDRIAKLDLAAADLDTELADRDGDVTRGDRAIKLTIVGGLANQGDRAALQFLGQLLGLGLALFVEALQRLTLALEVLDVGLVRAQSLLLRQQVVTRIARA